MHCEMKIHSLYWTKKKKKDRHKSMAHIKRETRVNYPVLSLVTLADSEVQSTCSLSNINLSMTHDSL